MGRIVVRILMGIGVALGVLLVVSGVLVAVFWDEAKVRASNLIAAFEEPEYAGGFADREEMLDYLKDHPGDFSLVVRSAGRSAGEGAEISHLPAEPSPLASTKKIVVLAAYAREVSEGRLDPGEKVAVSEWERYYIPDTDGGAHPAAMEDLGIQTDENGGATDAGATAPLDEMAGAMVSVSDNAATDYLIERLGQGKIRAIIEDEGLTGQRDVLPISGSLLLWSGPDGEGTPGLPGMGREEYAARVLRETGRYRDGKYPEEWREGRAPLGSLVGQRALAATYETKGKAEDYARIMGGVASGEFISPEVAGIMAEHLDWPMERPSNKEEFRTLGAKGGSLSGILTQAMYAVPKREDHAGEERVVVLFMRDMSGSAWLGVQQSDGYDDFTKALLTDGEFAGKVERELGGSDADR